MKQDADLYNADNAPFVFNLSPTFEHVSYLFEDTQFVTFALNTLWVGLFVVAITLAVSLPAAYSLARLNMPWAGPLSIAIFFVYLVPPTLLFIALTRVVSIARPAGLDVVARAHLPDDHDSRLGVAADGLLEGDPA